MTTLSYEEFKASVKNIGLKDSLYFARILGVSMAQAQLYVIRLYKGLDANNNQLINDTMNVRG